MHPCRQLRQFLPVTLVAIILLAGCGSGGSPIAPWTGAVPTAPSPPASGPRLLLAGQSNAAYLQVYLFQPVTVISGGSIDYWLQSVEFADKARTPDLEAFVWWQGLGDAGRTTVDDYARKLRDLIAIARTTHPGLPVRIVEILNTPDRAIVREAQARVASDANVDMIPTSDLALDGSGEHFTEASYQTVRDRIYRSIGR